MSGAIISRERWGAVHEDGFGSAPLPASQVWLHHSVTLAPDIGWLDADRDGVDDDEERAMRTLEAIGESRFGRGISYTFLIPPSGRIYEGHGVDRQGSHTGGRNDIARAICLIGDYDTHKPTDAQIRSAAWLLQEGKLQGWWTSAQLNGGHRDLKATACPGRYAYLAIADINNQAAGPPIMPEEDDMTADQERKLDAVYQALFYGSSALGVKYPGLLGTVAAVQLELKAMRGELSDDEAKVLAALNADRAAQADAVARALAPLLLDDDGMSRLSDDDVHRLRDATADEIDRRARERANQEV